MSDRILPVILCGGSGTRLWPLSRKSYPKQFADLLGDASLFQRTAKRVSGANFAAPTIVTGDPFRFVVQKQLADLGITPAHILIEPSARNTAAAVLAAALALKAEDENALLLVAPSDHIIPDTQAFQACVSAAADMARSGTIITFGIAPSAPHTGYGYLELAEGSTTTASTPQPLDRFIEKPDHARAEAMLADGRYLWNAGIFLISVRTIVTAFEAHAPETLTHVRAAVDGACRDLGFLRLASDPWDTLEDISIDYAIMEKAQNIAAMPFTGAWSDLGGWQAVWEADTPDDQGTVTSGPAHAIDCRNALLRAEDPDQTVVGIGLEDLVVIAMPDAVLVAPKSEDQRVKEAVALLKAEGLAQATQLPRDYRPWGWFDSLATGDRFQVKRIVVNPGASLSLQSHVHRAEHWVVVVGTAKVTVDDEVRLVTENQSIYIPLGAVHRMENPGKVPMVLIEVQTGSYLGEDDIIRYEDQYARS